MFSEVVEEIKRKLFATGVPVISTTAMTENEYLHLENVMAASIFQGGSSPCFLKLWVYSYMVSGQLYLAVDYISKTAIKTFVEKIE